jgi:hypothetical protein
MKLILILTLLISAQMSFALSKKEHKKCAKIFKKWKKSKKAKLEKEIEKYKCLEDEEFQYEKKRVDSDYPSKFSFKEKKIKKAIQKWLEANAKKYDTFRYFYESHQGKRKFIEKKWGDCSIRIYPNGYEGEANIQVKSTFEFVQAYNDSLEKLQKGKDIKEVFTSKKLVKKLTKYVYDDCLMREGK